MLNLCLGLMQKKDFVLNDLDTNKIDICCLQETEILKDFPTESLNGSLFIFKSEKNSLKSTSRCSDGRLFRFLLLVGGRRARSKNTAGEEEDDPSWLKTGPGLSLYTTETVPYKSVVLQIRLTNTTASKRQCRVFQFVDYKKCKAKKRFTSIPTLLLPSKEKMDDHHKKHNRNVI